MLYSANRELDMSLRVRQFSHHICVHDVYACTTSVGLVSSEPDVCTAQGHNVDCHSITKPLHVCESGTQQGFPDQVRNAKAPYRPEKYMIFDIHCWRSLLLQAVKLDPDTQSILSTEQLCTWQWEAKMQPLQTMKQCIHMHHMIQACTPPCSHAGGSYTVNRQAALRIWMLGHSSLHMDTVLSVYCHASFVVC